MATAEVKARLPEKELGKRLGAKKVIVS